MLHPLTEATSTAFLVGLPQHESYDPFANTFPINAAPISGWPIINYVLKFLVQLTTGMT